MVDLQLADRMDWKEKNIQSKNIENLVQRRWQNTQEGYNYRI